jgi:hypothetical protein
VSGDQADATTKENEKQKWQKKQFVLPIPSTSSNIHDLLRLVEKKQYKKVQCECAYA